MHCRNDKVEGVIRVEDDIDSAGVVAGTPIIGGRKTLRPTGMTNALVVETGARAIIHGTVAGAVVDEGGHIEVHGSVGSIDTDGHGTIRIFPDALIGGARR